MVFFLVQDDRAEPEPAAERARNALHLETRARADAAAPPRLRTQHQPRQEEPDRGAPVVSCLNNCAQRGFHVTGPNPHVPWFLENALILPYRRQSLFSPCPCYIV